MAMHFRCYFKKVQWFIICYTGTMPQHWFTSLGTFFRWIAVIIVNTDDMHWLTYASPIWSSRRAKVFLVYSRIFVLLMLLFWGSTIHMHRLYYRWFQPLIFLYYSFSFFLQSKNGLFKFSNFFTTTNVTVSLPSLACLPIHLATF